MQKQQAKKKSPLKRLLQIIVPVVILGLVVFFLARNWDKEWQEIAKHSFQINYWLMAGAFVGFLLQELSYGFIWRNVLARLGSRLGFRPALRIYLASEFVRYIPGNVWHVLTRILWVGKEGVPRSVAFASMVIELTTKLIAGALIFAASLLFWGNFNAFDSLFNGGELAFAGLHLPMQSVVIALGVIGILITLVILHPRVLNGLLGWGLRLLKRDPVVLPLRYRDILVITLMWCGSWIVAGCAFFVLLLALWSEAPISLLPICIGIYALAWDVGFLSFITPSGLGVREVTIMAAFAPFPALVSGGLPLAVAALSRVISTVAELLCVGLAYIGGGRLIRSLQREEEERSSQIVDPVDENETSNILAETVSSAHLEVERGIGK
jgi:uncharacterized membrane protein YbhN (UPF0104 family)